MIGIDTGVTKAGTIRRTGSQRRWDAFKVGRVCGSPWKMTVAPAESEKAASASKVRFMTEKEKDEGVEVKEEDVFKPGRVRLLKEDYIEHGFTQGCPGCKAIINQERARTHSESCRIRLEKLLEASEDGKNRKRKADDKSNEWIAQKMQRRDEEEPTQPQQQDDFIPGRACGSERPNTPMFESNSKRSLDNEVGQRDKKRKVAEDPEEDELLLQQVSVIEKSSSGVDLIELF